MKVLLDLNIVLDVLLGRDPWYAEAQDIWDSNLAGRMTAYLAAFSMPTAFYIVRKQKDLTTADRGVQICLKSLAIVPVDRSTLEKAAAGPGPDFEDNLQIACAVEAGLDAIVTRDPLGFSNSPIPVFTPADLLARLGISPPGP